MIDGSRVEFYGSGKGAENVKPGDFILTHGSYWQSKLIRIGQSLRFSWNEASRNHAALVYTEDGWLAEALGNGVVTSHIDKYLNGDYWLVRIDASEEDRGQIQRFARSVLEARWKYSWTTMISVSLSLLTGQRYVLIGSGSATCSGFVSESLVRAGYIWPKPPVQMLPADLAAVFFSKESSA